MLVAIIGGAAVLGLLGGVLRIALNPIGALLGLIRVAAFLFSAGCWLAYGVLDSQGQAEVMPAAIIGTIVWVVSVLIPSR